MKTKQIRPILTLAVAAVLFLASGCITIVTTSPAATTTATTEPIIGEWNMTRVGINPELPVPEIFINQVVNQTSVWKFQRVNGRLVLRFDGKDTWYKAPLGVNINKQPVSVIENSGNSACVFSSGGSIDLGAASGVISQLIGEKIEQATADFTDNIAVSFVQGSNNSKIRATINTDISGKYYGEMETGGMKWKTLQQKMTFTYDGVRR